jgi:hypothetical protein
VDPRHSAVQQCGGRGAGTRDENAHSGARTCLLIAAVRILHARRSKSCYPEISEYEDMSEEELFLFYLGYV